MMPLVGDGCQTGDGTGPAEIARAAGPVPSLELVELAETGAFRLEGPSGVRLTDGAEGRPDRPAAQGSRESPSDPRQSLSPRGPAFE